MKALRFYHGMVMCAKFKVGDRISYSDYNCTILYVGEISVWPGEIAYGVEWDDDTRGKHNGKLGGIKYFNTIRPKSGSFLKVSKVDVSADPRRSFMTVFVRSMVTLPQTNSTLILVPRWSNN